MADALSQESNWKAFSRESITSVLQPLNMCSVINHGLESPAYPAVMNGLLLCSLPPFFRPPFFPFRRAGVWSRYFQIATARSHVAKIFFSLLSGAFKDSLKIAPRPPNASPTPRDVTH